jgi:hypothetical protein
MLLFRLTDLVVLYVIPQARIFTAGKDSQIPQGLLEHPIKAFMEAELGQRVIIKFLSVERCPADNIRTRLLSLYGEATYAAATISKWIRELRTE